jgi:hypothetical protein
MNNQNNPNPNTGTFWKAIATIATCVMLIVSLAIVGVFMAPNMGEDSLGGVFMVMAAAIVINGFIWNWGSTGQRKLDKKERESTEDELYDIASSVGEKRKRDKLAVSLSHLSDNELIDLRQKLRNGDIDEQELAEILKHHG